MSLLRPEREMESMAVYFREKWTNDPEYSPKTVNHEFSQKRDDEDAFNGTPAVSFFLKVWIPYGPLLPSPFLSWHGHTFPDRFTSV